MNVSSTHTLAFPCFADPQDGEWWPASVVQSHPVKGVNMHFLGKSPADDRWVEPSACSTLLRPLPRIKPKRYTDELWDELHRRLSKQSKQQQQPAATVVDERKDHTAAPSKSAMKLSSAAPLISAAAGPHSVTPLPAKHKPAKQQSTSPPITASSANDKKRTTNTVTISSPTQPAPPNAQRPTKLASSETSTYEFRDTYQTPGKEETHPLSATLSKRALAEQLHSLQSRYDSDISQVRDELAAVRLAGVVPLQQPPPPHSAADLLIVHTLHERYNRAVSRLESEAPVASDELLTELRGLVDWHLEMTSRLNRLLRLKESDMAAALPSYH